MPCSCSKCNITINCGSSDASECARAVRDALACFPARCTPHASTYLTSLFRKKLHPKAKGEGKGTDDGNDKDHDRSVQRRDHVTLEELKELICMSGGAKVGSRDLRKLSADYVSRIQGVRQSTRMPPLRSTSPLLTSHPHHPTPRVPIPP